jgi:hypothetical protein
MRQGTGVAATVTGMTGARFPVPPEFSEQDRARFEELAGFRVADTAGGFVSMVPIEPRGEVQSYFHAHRVADAGTKLDSSVFEPVRQHPGYDDPDIERRKRMLEFAVDVGPQPTELADALEGITAAIAGLSNIELPAYLEQQLPTLFRLFPEGSLWLVSVEPKLLFRLTLMHGVSSLYLTPDMPMGREEFTGFDALDEHSLTRGVSFAPLFNPILLAYAPATIGFAFDRQPQTLVFLFGEPINLIQEERARSLASLYEPRIFEPLDDDVWLDDELYDRFQAPEAEELLQWWVERLNVFYTYAADPRNFEVPELGFAEPREQRGWFLSLERMIADATSALAGVQKPALDRLNALFDFLDKAESLLGYGSDRPGRGYKALVTRGQALRCLDDYYRRSLPEPLRKAFNKHAKALFDRVCDRVYADVVPHRRGRNAVLVDCVDHDEPRPKPLDDYVAELVRATRNSAHGLIEQLSTDERHLIGVHHGGLPRETPFLAAPLLLGFAAGAEDFCAQTWMRPTSYEEPKPATAGSVRGV